MKRSPLSTSAFALAAAHTALVMPSIAHAGAEEGWDLIQQIEVKEDFVDGELSIRKSLFVQVTKH